MISVMLLITQMLHFSHQSNSLNRQDGHKFTCGIPFANRLMQLEDFVKSPAPDAIPSYTRRHRCICMLGASPRGHQQFFICRSDSIASSDILTLAFLILYFSFTYQTNKLYHIK
jgi:hypothetical protein